MTPTFHNAYYTDDFFSKLEDDLSSEGVGFPLFLRQFDIFKLTYFE